MKKTNNLKIFDFFQEFFTFQLQRHEPTLFTKLRPGCREFLAEMTRYFEMQIVTFGSRLYAHRIALFLDPDQKLFAERILSRNECFHPQRKSSNLKYEEKLTWTDFQLKLIVIGTSFLVVLLWSV